MNARPDLEVANRKVKVSKLSRAIDTHVYEVLRCAGPDGWAKFAKSAGTKPPSDKTIEMVIKRFKRRSKR